MFALSMALKFYPVIQSMCFGPKSDTKDIQSSVIFAIMASKRY